MFSSKHLKQMFTTVQLLSLWAKAVHVIKLAKMDYCMCLSLWSNRSENVYLFPIYTVGLPTSWPWSQLLLISLERKGMLCLKDDSLNKVGSLCWGSLH